MRRKSSGGIKIIGVAGACAGCGATHFVLSAANFLSNVKGIKTVVGWYGDGRDFRQAQIILCPNAGDGGRFVYAGITFLDYSDRAGLPGAADDAEYILLDLGYDINVIKEYFPRCNLTLLFGAANEWRVNSFVTQAVRLTDAGGCHPAYLAAFYSDKGLRLFKAGVGKAVEKVPYEPEPFCLHGETIDRMEKIIFKKL